MDHQARIGEIERKRDKLEFNPECTFEPQLDGKKLHDRPRSGISKNRAKSDMGMTRSLVLYENFNRI